MLEAQKSDEEKILTHGQPNLGHILGQGKPLDDKNWASISTQKCVELWPREQKLVASICRGKPKFEEFEILNFGGVWQPL